MGLSLRLDLRLMALLNVPRRRSFLLCVARPCSTQRRSASLLFVWRLSGWLTTASLSERRRAMTSDAEQRRGKTRKDTRTQTKTNQASLVGVAGFRSASLSLSRRNATFLAALSVARGRSASPALGVGRRAKAKAKTSDDE